MTRPDVPLFATVNVTGACNLSCGYCFFQPRSRDLMKWGDFCRVIDELADLSLFFVNISGGEPFTHPAIDRMLCYAHDKFEYVIVLSNGTILLPQHREAIASIVHAKGGFPIQVSLDSVDPAVNARTRTDSTPILQNLRTLSELGANVVVAMVVTAHNCDALIDSMLELSNYTRYFHLMPFQPVAALGDGNRGFEVPPDRLQAIWNQVEDLRQERDLVVDIPQDRVDSSAGCAAGAPCMAAFTQIVIDPSLRVRPCDRLVDTMIGDLNKSSVSEIWESQACTQILERQVPLCREKVGMGPPSR